MSRKIAFIALSMGFLFEATVFAESPGLGYLFFWLWTFLGTHLLLRVSERPVARHLWMFLPSLLFSFSVFRFDGLTVQIWGAALAIFSLLWAVAWNLVPYWPENCLARLLPSETWNPLLLCNNARETLKVDHKIERSTLIQTLRGLVLSGFLLLVFGVLLSQADALFGAKLREFVAHFEGLAPQPVLRCAIWTGLFAGALRLWLSAQKLQAPESKTVFGVMELSMALGSLNLLLLSFLALQARYLFGGSALVESLGINYANYARRGFFELALCIALILPLVLIGYRASEVHKAARLRFLGGGLILSAFGLAASAFRRMMLYIEVYGLSVERFYAAIGILVAVSILLWAGYACLRPRPISWLLVRQNLTVLGLLSLLALVDVEAMVSRSHLALVQSGTRQLDVYYLSTLSADILPVLESYRPVLDRPQQEGLDQIRETILSRTSHRGIVSYNISRHRAKPGGAHNSIEARPHAEELGDIPPDF